MIRAMIDMWGIEFLIITLIFCVFAVLVILAGFSAQNEEAKIEEDRKFKQDIKNFNL